MLVQTHRDPPVSGGIQGLRDFQNLSNIGNKNQRYVMNWQSRWKTEPGTDEVASQVWFPFSPLPAQESESPRWTGSSPKMLLLTTPKITLALSWWFEGASYSVSPWIWVESWTARRPSSSLWRQVTGLARVPSGPQTTYFMTSNLRFFS